MLKKKQNMLDYKIYLEQIIEMIRRIEDSIPLNMTMQEFQNNYLLSDATLMRVHVIGETMDKIPYSFKKEYKNIKWKKFVTIRNVIGHKYSVIRYKVIWDLIKNYFPQLKIDIQKILTELK